MFERFDSFTDQMTFVDVFNVSVFLIFTCCYAYQLFYVLVVLVRKPPVLTAKRNHRYAVMVPARNEGAVVGDLVRSVKMQNYPQGLIDVFVIADNCTDDTADVARAAGATVLFRTDTELVGKGYALDYGFKVIFDEYADRNYEAFFVFDADNVLDRNYFREMNATFDNGAKAATSYRNSKNCDSNWISAGYALWFLREAKFLSQARLVLNTSCAISGTGFYISADIIRENDGWSWHLLTEDIEFSAYCIMSGIRISYCPTAILYDEQPITFRDSWNQRFRWAKGFYQVFWNYGLRLAKGVASNSRGYRFACYDMLMTVSPGMLLTVLSMVFNAIVVVLGLVGVLSFGEMVASSLAALCFCLLNYAAFMFFLGLITTCSEWRAIKSSPGKKILHVLTFPLFMLTYIFIALAALVGKAEWKPIVHCVSVDVAEYSVAAGDAPGRFSDTKGRGDASSVVESREALSAESASKGSATMRERT